MLVVAAFLLAGGAGPVDRAVAGSERKACGKACRAAKKACFGGARTDLVTVRRKCTSERKQGLTLCEGDQQCKRDQKKTFKDCRKSATAGFRLTRRACRAEFKTCKTCCRDDGTSCVWANQISCPPNPAGGPNLLTMTVVAGGDLDVGWTGVGHNQGIVMGGEVSACLENCDMNTNPICTGTAPAGLNHTNGKALCVPIPLLAADVALCVVNQFPEDMAIRTLNLRTGEVEMRAQLRSSVYLTGYKKTPCPTCTGATIGAAGTCEGSTPSRGERCRTEGTTVHFGNTSRDCLPYPQDNAGEVEIEIDPITTGTVTRKGEIPCSGGLCLCAGGGNQPLVNECDDPDGCSEELCRLNGGSDDVREGTLPGVDQECCMKGEQVIPCYGEEISRTGEAIPLEPTWPDPTYPKTATGGKVAAVFCIPPTNGIPINQPVGVGGPGAFVIPGDVSVEFAD